MGKSHRHVNIVQFVGLMERSGLGRDRIVNGLPQDEHERHTDEEVLDMADESRINAETGRLYKATVEFE